VADIRVKSTTVLAKRIVIFSFRHSTLLFLVASSSNSLPPGPDWSRVPRLSHVRRLSQDRSGHSSIEHVRHQLYVARDAETRAEVLLKVTTKPGIVYEQNLANEAATLAAINRELPDSRHFPLLLEQGRLADGRLFLIMSLFPELPLATTIGPERRPDRLVGYLRTVLAVGSALAELHGIGVFHVDLNPMNILYRSERGAPVVRIVDFESAYEVARHGTGVFYNPPTTTGFSAPEVPAQAPDARADVFSLGAGLYTTIAGYQWTWGGELGGHIRADTGLEGDIAAILLTATNPDRERRYHSVPEMCAAVAVYLESIWPGSGGRR
jgi:serine/threonine protein kinase